MGNIVLASALISDSATVTAGNETAAGPVSNLQKMQPSDIWESSTTSSYIEVDLGAVTAFNLISLLFTNAVATDTWRIRTADTQGNLTAAPDEDTTVTALTDISPDGHIFHWVEAEWTNQWIRIDIATAASPFMAGRLYIADAFQPERLNYEFNNEDGYDDDSIISITDGGNLIPSHGINRPILNITMNIMTEADRHEIRELHRTVGAQKDVVVITDPDAVTNVGDRIYPGLLQRRRVTVKTTFNRSQVSYQLIGFVAGSGL